MFTFGRKHERESAAFYGRTSDERATIVDFVNSVHDYLEDPSNVDITRSTLQNAIEAGGSRVWVSAAYWLRRLAWHNESFDSVWHYIATAHQAKIRFRCAACINELPLRLTTQLLPLILKDRSREGRDKAFGDFALGPSKAVRAALQELDLRELDPDVASRIPRILKIPEHPVSSHDHVTAYNVRKLIDVARRDLPLSPCKAYLKSIRLDQPIPMDERRWLVYNDESTGLALTFDVREGVYSFRDYDNLDRLSLQDVIERISGTFF